MIAIRKTLVLACAVSVLGLGAAFAQTDPNAAAPAAPAAAGAATAPSGDMGQDASAMPKKSMKHKKHMSKKMMKKNAM